MDPALTAACVAGAITLVGVWINYRLAAATRRAARDHLRFGRALQTAEHAVREIKAFCGEAEKLRNACWQLLTEVSSLQNNRQDNFEVLQLQKLEQPFARACRSFFQAWAIVKSEIPDSTVDLLRDLRQQSKNEADEIQAMLAEMTQTIEKTRGSGTDERLYTLRLKLENLHGNLDRLFYTLFMARDSILVDAWIPKRR